MSVEDLLAAARSTLDRVDPARALAEYRKKIDTVWSRIQIFDTELTAAPPESLVVGNEVRVRARIDLAGLDPEDVEVQAVVGRVADTDDLHEPITMPMACTGIGEFSAVVRLPHAGTLGYTVRILPRHALLATPAELGRVLFA